MVAFALDRLLDCSEALEHRLGPLLDASDGGDAKVVRNYLRMIQEEAFRCKEITQKLLDFSRTGGKRERTDLNRLMSDVLDMARHLPNCKGKGIMFRPDAAVAAHSPERHRNCTQSWLALRQR